MEGATQPTAEGLNKLRNRHTEDACDSGPRTAGELKAFGIGMAEPDEVRRARWELERAQAKAALQERVTAFRRAVKGIATDVRSMQKENSLLLIHAGYDANEARENLDLCYRHLEDASMRLGKTLQAIDGGVSVYDRSTTVGA